MKYLIVYEQSENGFSAYSPDLPGCIASGDTFEETKQLIHDGIDFHLEGLHEMGLPIPQPFQTEYHEVASAA